MTMTAASMFAVSHEQLANAIIVNGANRTVIAEGHMGIGKSAMLPLLAQRLPTHTPCYFDCTTKDVGDVLLPNFKEMKNGAGYVTYVTNEELGVHLSKPVVIMIDEIGKNRAIQNSIMRLIYERKIGSYTLHPDSIVFGTTNLGAENVGDMFPPQGRNRVTFMRMRKPTAAEWIEWGIGADVDHTVLGWVRDNPHVFDSFETVDNPDDNPYIFHPKANRLAFVTPRSLEAASDWVKGRAKMDTHTLTASLIGTVGERAGLDLMAFVQLADQLPTLESIKTTPDKAKVPTSAAGVCMVVYRAMMSLDLTWVDAWFTYLRRLDREAQGMFINGIRAKSYDPKKRDAIMNADGFGKWLFDMGWLFAADKK